MYVHVHVCVHMSMCVRTCACVCTCECVCACMCYLYCAVEHAGSNLKSELVHMQLCMYSQMEKCF